MGSMRISLSACVVLAGVANAIPAAAQENKLSLNAEVVSAYDSNFLRLGGRSESPKDNESLNPQVRIDFSRRFGRQRAFVAGTAGYVFNSRYSQLNRESINISGGANIKAGARCGADPAFSLIRSQSDLEDLGGTISNTFTQQNYDLSLSCPRAVGFSPKLSGAYGTLRSSGRPERNQDVYGGRANLVYNLPSLGTVEAFVEYTHSERPDRLGINNLPLVDITVLTTYGVHYNRAVGTLLTLDGSLSRTSVNPSSRLIPSFSGLTYAGGLSYRRSALGTLRVGFNRSVNVSNNVGSSYSINRTVFAGIDLTVTSKINTGAQFEYGTRQFRGEDNIFRRLGPRGSDKVNTVSANASYRLFQRVRLTLTGRYRIRNSENDNYDYSSKQVALTTSLRL